MISVCYNVPLVLVNNKINAFVGFNPLHTKELNLWVIGNLVGNEFAPGLGLSYKVK
jgi:hypothetical protein